jgi:hypothetical protein
VDKHLAECNPCMRMLNEMRQTVSLLATAPRFEVSQDFMAKLESRIAGVQPAPARRAWLSGLRELFRPRTLPAWGGAALAACALSLLMIVPKPSGTVIAPPTNEPAIVQTARNQDVVLAASNPLGDASAAALVAAGQDTEAQ